MLGQHPEYWTHAMRSALDAYLRGGGRVMYLGGNGLWWVTSIDPERPHVIEVRKSDLFGAVPGLGVAGGEAHHSTTGERGGNWRERSLPPESTLGVGYASQGFASARPFHRTEAGRSPEFGWVFDGLDPDEPIGDFGLAMGGAAGDEFDRAETDLGSPPATRVLASSSGHDAFTLDYSLVYDYDEARASRIRADIAYTPMPNGGAVFAAGSMCWLPALPWNGYDNNVSRITENVLRRFLED
jgi:N,N-dimethylformamidase